MKKFLLGILQIFVFLFSSYCTLVIAFGENFDNSFNYWLLIVHVGWVLVPIAAFNVLLYFMLKYSTRKPFEWFDGVELFVSLHMLIFTYKYVGFIFAAPWLLIFVSRVVIIAMRCHKYIRKKS